MREFLFEYRYDESEWGISIFAEHAVEARERIKAVGLARYKGEVGAKIKAPNFLSRVVGRLIFGMKFTRRS